MKTSTTNGSTSAPTMPEESRPLRITGSPRSVPVRVASRTDARCSAIRSVPDASMRTFGGFATRSKATISEVVLQRNVTISSPGLMLERNQRSASTIEAGSAPASAARRVAS